MSIIKKKPKLTPRTHYWIYIKNLILVKIFEVLVEKPIRPSFVLVEVHQPSYQCRRHLRYFSLLQLRHKFIIAGWEVLSIHKIIFQLLRSEIPSGICAKLRTVAASNNRVHAPRSLYYCLFAPHMYIIVLRAHPVRGEPHIQRNGTGEVATNYSEPCDSVHLR